MLVPKTYKILTDSIEIGLELGWNRAHKHSDKPSKKYIIECMLTAIRNEISDNFDFETPQPIIQEFTNRITEVGFSRGKDIEG